MSMLEKALKMLEKYPLCDHCLGRQFALLGHGLENHERGRAIKTVLVLEANAQFLSGKRKGIKVLRILAKDALFKQGKMMLHKLKKHMSGDTLPRYCYLCGDRFKATDRLVDRIMEKLEKYEHRNFIVGVKLPVEVEEREDEFKAEFEVQHGENIRNEFGRTIGKKIAEGTEKAVEHRKPEIVAIVNPMTEEIRLKVNPLYVAGRYRKLVRGIPQSRWLCSHCRGKGCGECSGTGKMYSESIEEIIRQPFLDVTGSVQASFHASGREDIDALMLGEGRPFVIEIKEPKRRFLDFGRLQEDINVRAEGKVKVSDLGFADKEAVRVLKKTESAEKEYRVQMEFEDQITPEDMLLLESRLTKITISQRTPTRVLHRRANLTRERYIYEVKVKTLSPRKAEMRIHCQGGLYVKELVTGDEGRTRPNISEILGNKAWPLELDVLNVITVN
ncbi:tRNA pseudouridine(54/55) synthase Pus10 [Candidatus Bathyarchaeota archaeon]|nr:tRNA pseudouridine(54/55) synthase Pus10 [Candidatus Bathyarchaeota archaeon]